MKRPATMLVLAGVALLASPGRGQAFQVQAVAPSKVVAEQGGSQIHASLKGSNLGEIALARVYLNKKRESRVLVRLEKAVGDSRKMIFLAAPQAPLSSEYRIAVSSRKGQSVWLPMAFEVIPNRNQEPEKKPSIEEQMSAEELPQVLEVNPEEVPLVQTTVPEPISIAATGIPQPVLLLGKRLDRVTRVRLRKASSPPTKNIRSGQIPFKLEDEAIRIHLLASPRTPVGSRYAIDLIMGQYVAQSLPFEVVAPAVPTLPSAE